MCVCVCTALNAYCGKTTGLILMRFLLLYLVSSPIDYVKMLVMIGLAVWPVHRGAKSWT